MSEADTTGQAQAASRRLPESVHAAALCGAGEEGEALRLWRLPAGLLLVEAPPLAEAELQFDGGPIHPPRCSIMLGTGPALRRLTVLRAPGEAAPGRVCLDGEAAVGLDQAHPIETFARLHDRHDAGWQSRIGPGPEPDIAAGQRSGRARRQWRRQTGS